MVICCIGLSRKTNLRAVQRARERDARERERERERDYYTQAKSKSEIIRHQKAL
jgi:hypothetical protein